MSGSWNVMAPFSPPRNHGNHSSNAVENSPTPAQNSFVLIGKLKPTVLKF